MIELNLKDYLMYLASGLSLYVVFWFVSCFFLSLIDFFVYIPKHKKD